jgi:hypothetical protein
VPIRVAFNKCKRYIDLFNVLGSRATIINIVIRPFMQPYKLPHYCVGYISEEKPLRLALFYFDGEMLKLRRIYGWGY